MWVRQCSFIRSNCGSPLTSPPGCPSLSIPRSSTWWTLRTGTTFPALWGGELARFLLWAQHQERPRGPGPAQPLSLLPRALHVLLPRVLGTSVS